MAKQRDIQGWASTTWGMTDAEILQLFPSAKQLDPPVKIFRGGEGVASVGIPKIEVVREQACQVHFFFDEKSGLNKVVIERHKDNIYQHEFFRIMLEFLEQKYGRPTKRVRDYMDPPANKDLYWKKVIWRFPSTIIELIEWWPNSSETVLLTYMKYIPDLSLL